MFSVFLEGLQTRRRPYPLQVGENWQGTFGALLEGNVTYEWMWMSEVDAFEPLLLSYSSNNF